MNLGMEKRDGRGLERASGVAEPLKHRAPEQKDRGRALGVCPRASNGTVATPPAPVAATVGPRLPRCVLFGRTTLSC